MKTDRHLTPTLSPIEAEREKRRDDRVELALALFVLAALGLSWLLGCG